MLTNICPLQLKSLGMALSGCEREATNDELVSTLKSLYPDLSESYSVVSDTVGSVITAGGENGGVVIIAGTGSNALLLNTDGSTAR
jgi:N-acetylglucosamine kinase